MTLIPLESEIPLESDVPRESDSTLVPIRFRWATSDGPKTKLIAFLRQRRVDIALVTILIVVAGLAHAFGMSENPGRLDDEGTYVSQAWAVQQGELAHYTYWYDHPPLGWIQLAAYDQVTNAFTEADTSVAGGRQAMLLVKIASVFALYVLARRLRFSAGAATLAVALFALGPLAITYQRGVWLDNIAVLWLLAAFALATEHSGKLRSAVLAAACFAIAVLTKETLLLVAPFLGWQMWRTFPAATRAMATAVTVATSSLLVLVYPLMAILRGELIPGDDHVSLLRSIHWQLVGRESTGSIWAGGTKANDLLNTYFEYDTGLLVLGLVALIPAVLVSSVRPLAACLLLHLALPFRGGYLPVPYVIILIPLIALCIAGVLDHLVRQVQLDDIKAFGRFLQQRLTRSQDAVRSTLTRRNLISVGSATMALLLAAFISFGVVPGWVTTHQNGDLRNPAADAGMQGAQQWIVDNVDRDSTIIVEDTIWLDMVNAGFEREKVIWFFKVDPDPAVEAGVEDVAYISLHTLAASEAQPTLARILARSEVVATFGEGLGEVTVWKVPQ